MTELAGLAPRHFLWEVESRIARLKLNRPERKNAVNSDMWVELLATLKEVGNSAEDRCVVLTG